MNTFSAENQLVLFACSLNPEIDALQQTITNIDDWAKACDKLIKKGVAPLFLELLEKNPTLVEGDKSKKRKVLRWLMVEKVCRRRLWRS